MTAMSVNYSIDLFKCEGPGKGLHYIFPANNAVMLGEQRKWTKHFPIGIAA